MADAPALLEAQGLVMRFGAFTALRGISATIRGGEVVGLIGTNGAGKTTFLNMVTGYLRPTEGRVLLEGRDVTGTGPREMVGRGLARSFQVPQLFPEMTAREHLVLAEALADQGQRSLLGPLPEGGRAEAMLARFGLAAIADTAVSLVPQGQRKLIDIAMALMLRPRLLLLDEPTSGVSSAEKGPLMQTVFEAIRAGGVTVLFVEHDMEIVERYVTRILAFRDGELLADGTPEAVLRDREVARSVLRRKEVAT
ncbi:ABC transporter ATP-binding protein [Muricoccus pecuniae]|uniref:Branched-chain amino acid transport system ATP-binding protein n=1 Tax=Muricoccus pecuniae TaxID=693023 RepID=A0A840YIL2_9PROT|nr:ATP-binding cassette domain-containing protein [Roseomonas pecuniae]MBB5696387.1 branched-chain amino acid transport system ATP-binding protein [Roseomonas pecuniae]